MKIRVSLTRLTASLLSLALIQASFASGAWAQLVPRVGEVAAPTGGFSPSAASAHTGASVNVDMVELRPPASLTNLPMAVAPPFPRERSDVPSLPLSAIAAPTATAGAEAAAVSAGRFAADPARSSEQAPISGPDVETEPGSVASTANVGSRVAVRIAELKNFFGGRRYAGAPGETPAAASVGEPNSPDAKSTKRMLGRYVFAGNSSQAGYEMLSSASMPIFLDQTFHKMSLMADLSIVGTLASIIGRQLSPLIVNSMPLKKSYLGMLVGTFGAALAIGILANLHALTVPALFGLMIVFHLLRAGTATAERTVIPSVLGKDQIAIERLRGAKQSWAEVGSVLVQNGAAAIVVLIGTATRNLLIAPFFYLAAISLQWSLKIPKAADDARAAAWREKAAQAGGGPVSSAFKNFAQQIAKGYQLVMRDPALRSSAMITTLMILFNVMTYSILAPAFGKFAIGAGATSSAAAPIMGLIAGLFSFGGLFAGKFVNKQARDLEAEHGKDAAAEAARSSTMRWLKYGALSFLAVGAMALPLPVVGPLIVLGAHASVAIAAILGAGTILAMWRPKLGLALAMAPVLLAFPSHVALAAVAFFGFGFTQVVALLKNDSLFDKLVQEKAPADFANAAAFVGSFSAFVGMLGLAALKFLIYGALPFGIPSPFPAFSGLPGIWPFVAIFGGLAVPAMFAMYSLARTLDRLTAPNSPKKS